MATKKKAVKKAVKKTTAKKSVVKKVVEAVANTISPKVDTSKEFTVESTNCEACGSTSTKKTDEILIGQSPKVIRGVNYQSKHLRKFECKKCKAKFTQLVFKA